MNAQTCSATTAQKQPLRSSVHQSPRATSCAASGRAQMSAPATTGTASSTTSIPSSERPVRQRANIHKKPKIPSDAAEAVTRRASNLLGINRLDTENRRRFRTNALCHPSAARHRRRSIPPFLCSLGERPFWKQFEGSRGNGRIIVGGGGSGRCDRARRVRRRDEDRAVRSVVSRRRELPRRLRQHDLSLPDGRRVRQQRRLRPLRRGVLPALRRVRRPVRERRPFLRHQLCPPGQLRRQLRHQRERRLRRRGVRSAVRPGSGCLDTCGQYAARCCCVPQDLHRERHDLTSTTVGTSIPAACQGSYTTARDHCHLPAAARARHSCGEPNGNCWILCTDPTDCQDDCGNYNSTACSGQICDPNKAGVDTCGQASSTAVETPRATGWSGSRVRPRPKGLPLLLLALNGAIVAAS